MADCFWDPNYNPVTDKCPAVGYKSIAANHVSVVHSGHSIVPMATLIVAIAALVLLAALTGYVMSNRKVAR